jgi:hypothetical protein
MTRIRVKGFQIFCDRHGKMRCYHRIARTPVNLGEAPLGSPEFKGSKKCRRITDRQMVAEERIRRNHPLVKIEV